MIKQRNPRESLSRQYNENHRLAMRAAWEGNDKRYRMLRKRFSAVKNDMEFLEKEHRPTRKMKGG